MWLSLLFALLSRFCRRGRLIGFASHIANTVAAELNDNGRLRDLPDDLALFLGALISNAHSCLDIAQHVWAHQLAGMPITYRGIRLDAQPANRIPTSRALLRRTIDLWRRIARLEEAAQRLAGKLASDPLRLAAPHASVVARILSTASPAQAGAQTRSQQAIEHLRALTESSSARRTRWITRSRGPASGRLVSILN